MSRNYAGKPRVQTQFRENRAEKSGKFMEITIGQFSKMRYNDMRVKRYFAPHLIHELLRCYATPAILHPFGIR